VGIRRAVGVTVGIGVTVTLTAGLGVFVGTTVAVGAAVAVAVTVGSCVEIGVLVEAGVGATLEHAVTNKTKTIKSPAILLFTLCSFALLSFFQYELHCIYHNTPKCQGTQTQLWNIF
jgi:hypothetical protein